MTSDALAAILESAEPERLATGFVFTEGPTWHPDGFLYFVDIRSSPSRLYRLVPGGRPEVVREHTGEGNGTTFDLDGNLLMCEGGNRRVTRMYADGRIEPVAERYEGKRFNRPNDIVCRSDGSLYFTDPGLRVPLAERELPHSGVYRVTPDGAITLIADCEYPNGLAFSPDERTLYVANTRWAQYIHALELGPDGTMVRRRIFADMSSDEPEGVPDGMKVDVEGRVYCTGPGGTWVFAPDGARLGLSGRRRSRQTLPSAGPTCGRSSSRRAPRCTACASRSRDSRIPGMRGERRGKGHARRYARPRDRGGPPALSLPTGRRLPAWQARRLA